MITDLNLNILVTMIYLGHQVVKLTGAFLKFEDLAGHYKPQYQEYQEIVKPCLQAIGQIENNVND